MQPIGFLFLTLSVLSGANCARILCIFPVAIVKELEVYQSIWTELAKRGHEVMVIAPNVLQTRKTNNVTLILTPQTALDPLKPTPVLTRKIGAFKDYYTKTYKEDLTLMEKQMAFAPVQKFIADENQKFDLVMVDVRAPAFFAFAAKFKCPLVGYSPTPPLPHVHQMLGNPVHPIWDSDACYSSEESNFWERVQCVYLDVWIRYFYHSVALRSHNSLAKKYLGKDIPYVGLLEKDMSLMFITSNFFLRRPRAYALSIIEVDRLHIKPKKSLPKELQTYLDGAKEGLIYVNLGPLIDDDVAKFLLATFAQLPYKVLWQFKEDKFKPSSNVVFMNYVPQQDVLGHKNIKAAILEGDIQSLEEAIVNKVPLIAIPFSADEIMNVKRVEDEGIGFAVGLEAESQQSLKDKILKVASTPSFKARVTSVADILRDEPMNGMKKIIWWVDYVIRNEDISHLKVPSLDIPWTKFLMLDIIAVALVLIVLICLLIYVSFAFCIRRTLRLFSRGRRYSGSKRVKKSV